MLNEEKVTEENKKCNFSFLLIKILLFLQK